jgi:REP element-mobilizing transposase RayT
MTLRRRSIRLQHYDYSQAGAYFVTICVHARECLLGEIVDGAMILNDYGKIVEEEWLKSAEIRKEIELDEYIIMPNHLHGIVVINNEGSLTVRAHGRAPLRSDPPILHREPRSLGSFIAGFKSITTKRINLSRRTPSFAVWQRNYYEHVVRDEIDPDRIREYVHHNPARWAEDENNLQRVT